MERPLITFDHEFSGICSSLLPEVLSIVKSANHLKIRVCLYRSPPVSESKRVKTAQAIYVLINIKPTERGIK